MKIIFSILAVIALTFMSTACTNRDVGTVGGAVVGGVAGSALTRGSPVGTVVGAVGGGYIGRQLSR